MGQKQQPELGTRSPITIRLGQTVPSFTGVDKERESSSVAPNAFTEAINVRIKPNGAVVCRGGQEKVNDDPLGPITGMDEDEGPAGSPILAMAFDPGVSRAVCYFDPEAATLSVSSAPADLRNRAGAWVTRSGSTMYFSMVPLNYNDPIEIYSCSRSNVVAGVASALFLSVPSMGGPDPGVIREERCTSVCYYGGLYWVGYSRLYDVIPPNPDPDSGIYRIYSWDGTALTTEDQQFIGWQPCIFRTHADLLMAGFRTFNTRQTAPTVLRKRSAGGVWSNVALPGGIAQFNIRSVALYNGATYIAGGTESIGIGYGADGGVAILKWNGSALTTVVAPLATTGVINSLVADGRYLYYLVARNDGVAQLMLGRFDGTTWNSSYRDLTNDVADVVTPTYTSAFLAKAGGRLRLVVKRAATASVYTPSSTDYSATWTETASSALVPFLCDSTEMGPSIEI